MNSEPYLALNAWLQKADQNYMEGRLLWLNDFIDGACNLLWLSAEQIIKILLLQKDISILSNVSGDLDDLHNKIDTKGKKLGHDVHKLIANVKSQYPDLDLTTYESMLIKLQEYFYRRYVINTGSVISLNMLDEIDEFYFIVRGKIDAEIGLGTIDEIFIQRKHNWAHPISSFECAYHKNKHFKTRPHSPINYMTSLGERITENGQ
ncbi:HEPN domain-containing protein [Flavobacterium sp. N2038]|uniref:HEPN domain-containing protein n=1 Tax=Flavobacterium sp. N2038 TaxID=2986829 RepID=UPI002225B606|nr:HEPN domain-containing protein [Flavobacterium sp. N2038]